MAANLLLRTSLVCCKGLTNLIQSTLAEKNGCTISTAVVILASYNTHAGKDPDVAFLWRSDPTARPVPATGLSRGNQLLKTKAYTRAPPVACTRLANHLYVR